MKKVLLLLAIASQVSAAEPEVLKFKAKVNVHSLACLTEVAQDAQFTILRRPTILQHAGKILLDHDILVAEGCEIPKLKEIYNQAVNTFGFLEADVEVRRAANAQIVTEELKVDLGRGLVLQDVQSAERNSRRCN